MVSMVPVSIGSSVPMICIGQSQTLPTLTGRARVRVCDTVPIFRPVLRHKKAPLTCVVAGQRGFLVGGAKEIRTPDLLDANEARYQLRHSPVTVVTPSTFLDYAYPRPESKLRH
jgi:hypothetical protein